MFLMLKNLLPDQISLSDCLYVLGYWAKSVLKSLSSCFPTCLKASELKFKYPQNKKNFYSEIKSIFHHFERVSSCQKRSQTCECTSNSLNTTFSISNLYFGPFSTFLHHLQNFLKEGMSPFLASSQLSRIW